MGRNYSDERISTINTRATVAADRARRTVREINAISGSQFDENLMAHTLEIYEKASSGYHLQTCSILTAPMVDAIGTVKNLQQQYIEAFRQSIIALRHNLKFVLNAHRVGSEITVKENNENKTVLADIDYLKAMRYSAPREFSNYNKVKTLRRDLQASKNSMNSLAVNVITTSITNVENLFKYIEKPTQEMIDAKAKACSAAENIIGCLNEGSIKLDKFYSEMKNAKSDVKAK